MNTKKLLKKIKKLPRWMPAALFAVIFAGLGAYILTVTHAASAATITLSPSTANVAVGSNVTVTVKVNSGTDVVSTAEADLKYDTSKLQFVSVDTSGTAFDLPLEGALNPSDNSIVRITHGDKTPGSGSQVLAAVTFKAVATGSAAISVNPSSLVFLYNPPDGQNPNIFTTTGSTGTTLNIQDGSAPTVPTGLNATNTTVNSTILNWTASTDNVGVDHYDIYQGTNKIGSSTTNSFGITGLQNPNTQYSFTVQAFDAAGNGSAQSAALVVTTLPDTTAPTVPTNLQATSITPTSVTLSWTNSTDNVGVKRYEVYQDPSTTAIASPTVTTYTVNGLTPGSPYTFKVKAFDNANNGSAQASLAVTTQADQIAPTAPTNLNATPGSDNVSMALTWTAATDNIGVTRYDVYQGTTKLGSTTATSYTATTLMPNTNYTFRVVAFDAAGNSTTSTTKSATTSVKTGDIDLDNAVGPSDFSLLALNFRKTNATRAMGDLSGDGTIDATDLWMLTSGWGK
jgi:chitodextrinase